MRTISFKNSILGLIELKTEARLKCLVCGRRVTTYHIEEEKMYFDTEKKYLTDCPTCGLMLVGGISINGKLSEEKPLERSWNSIEINFTITNERSVRKSN